MKLKFDASLAFQADAIDSVIKVFDGQPVAESTFSIAFYRPMRRELIGPISA